MAERLVNDIHKKGKGDVRVKWYGTPNRVMKTS